MYLLFADEADHDGDRARFFVYGGTFIDSARAPALSDSVERIRRQAGMAPTDSLKFATRSRPEGMGANEHRSVKQQVLEAASQHGCKFTGYVFLHDIAANRSNDELIQWGANTVLAKFNQFLGEAVNETGVAYFDRIPVEHENHYLREKFQRGMVREGRHDIRLDRILAFASTCDGASHLASVADILVGSFRYCVNEPDRDVAGTALWQQILPVLWASEAEGVERFTDRGLVCRPQAVRAPEYAAEYEALLQRLGRYAQNV